MIKNIKNNLDHLINIKFNKIIILLFLMVFFSLLYMLLDDKHFEGVNKFKEIIKEEVIKDKVKKEIIENFANVDTFDNSTLDNSNTMDINSINNINNDKGTNNIVKEQVMDIAAKETEKEVKETELEPAKVEPSIFDKYFNRLYFAIVTGCLLGYGDIYPVTNTSKFISGLQGLLTVSLIVY